MFQRRAIDYESTAGDDQAIASPHSNCYRITEQHGRNNVLLPSGEHDGAAVQHVRCRCTFAMEFSLDLECGCYFLRDGDRKTPYLQSRFDGFFRRLGIEADHVSFFSLRTIGISFVVFYLLLYNTDLLKRFLCRDPTSRISIDEILVLFVHRFERRHIPG